ncbi:apolipoprotein N-acyltransferase [Mycolicibacterium madagascariense]|uniref:Apolipoprotein N-acyltransferase n=1 Tax=Mycolicibacterium madagascariense TaxID=212765 RepID=A0A7I7XIM6_9MYCO|nr:apolipoprotein N-acyltransferase [Mycolicibacterium madagascariense]MCV7011098.1 apolipoprotein N-acyltransferase [Mycolicibacterium madagascariense]BBZ29003.1 apolipoprotein N-acyltransferase [Mycolicibacterium madagascariense]
MDERRHRHRDEAEPEAVGEETDAEAVDDEAVDAETPTPDGADAPEPATREPAWSRVATRLRRALVPRALRLAASLAAGVLLCVSFPPFGWWPAAFLALALLTWVLTDASTTKAGGFGYGFLAGLAFYVPLIPWISGLVGPFPWLALSALEALFPAVFGLLAVIVRRLPGWPVWFACLWVLAEWLKSTIPFGGFPWGAVGFSQDDSPLLVLAHYGGVPLVSFAVALVGVGLAALVIELVQWWRRDHHVRHGLPPAVAVPGVSVALVLLVVALGTPYVRHSGAGAGEDPTTTVAAVQGNVPRLGLEFNAQRRAVLDNHVQETMHLAEEVRAGRAPQPAVVIWPENSSDIDPIVNHDAADEIAAAVDAIRAPILVGAVVSAPGYTPEDPQALNTVIVWDGATGPGERHDKKIVQPFGEYLPWRGFFRLLSSFADRAGYFVPGHGDGVVHAAGIPIGVTTCWEVIFDRAARESVLNGAQFLAVPTNNATFDASMSAQQLSFARLRAVEHDRFVVVAGTTGISAVIGPDGRIVDRTAFFEPAYLDAQIRLKTSLTPATRWGPVAQGLLVFAGAAAVVGAMLHNGAFAELFARRRRKAAAAEESTTAVDDHQDEGVT